MLNTNKISVLKQCIKNIEENVAQVHQLLNLSSHEGELVDMNTIITEEDSSEHDVEGRVIYGIFNGQQMISAEDTYSIPANYASKSKLVAGDSLKLMIRDDGSFVYKQIKPVARKRLVGTLVKDSKTGAFKAKVGDALYQVLLASVTYFKGDVGDEIVILVPTEMVSSWAAVDKIIKINEAPFGDDLLGV